MYLVYFIIQIFLNVNDCKNLDYLFPGPCLSRSKLDVSCNQLIPSWKKETIDTGIYSV